MKIKLSIAILISAVTLFAFSLTEEKFDAKTPKMVILDPDKTASPEQADLAWNKLTPTEQKQKEEDALDSLDTVLDQLLASDSTQGAQFEAAREILINSREKLKSHTTPINTRELRNVKSSENNTMAVLNFVSPSSKSNNRNTPDCKTVSEGMDPYTETRNGSYFTETLKPILINTCIMCHNGSPENGGLDTSSYDNLMLGSADHPQLIIAGDPENSYFYKALT
ncbi:MAG: c-type cytochrome domain-containing protein, partial [Planctomycetota bacterium]|nr:c-type cytochrome domain-containing protein [Planctomycetota bacterium]